MGVLFTCKVHCSNCLSKATDKRRNERVRNVVVSFISCMLYIEQNIRSRSNSLSTILNQAVQWLPESDLFQSTVVVACLPVVGVSLGTFPLLSLWMAALKIETHVNIHLKYGVEGSGVNGTEQEHLLSKAKSSTIQRGHGMDGRPLCARLCARPKNSLEGNSVQTLQKSFGWDCKLRYPHVHTHAKRSHTHVKESVAHVGVWWIMETLKIAQHALKHMKCSMRAWKRWIALS